MSDAPKNIMMPFNRHTENAREIIPNQTMPKHLNRCLPCKNTAMGKESATMRKTTFMNFFVDEDR